MFIAYIILAIIISFMLVASGVAKMRRDPRIIHSIHEVVGVPLRFIPWLAVCEFAGAAGLLVGIVWWPLGIAAAIGVIIYFIGADIGHVRVNDFKSLPAPTVFLLIAIAILVVRSVSLS